MSAASLMNQTRKMREAIWETEPAEVRKALKETMGTFEQSFFPAIYAVEGTRNVHMTLVSLRKTALSQTNDVETVKVMLKEYLLGVVTPNFVWGGVLDAANFLEDVAKNADEVSNREELIQLLEELALYVGRLNYWLDAAMPWKPLLTTYEIAKGSI